MAVEFAGVFTDQLVTFPELFGERGGIVNSGFCLCEYCSYRAREEAVGRRRVLGTWTAGSGFQKMALMDSMFP